MADEAPVMITITKPGFLTFGTKLPAGFYKQSFIQDETVFQVSCGVDHTAIVCESGRVYTIQPNGSLNLLSTLASVKINQVACGKQFTVFITDMGQLYAYGMNEMGQLGLGHTDNISTPTLVTGLPPVKKVATGVDYTVALTVNNEVWVSGSNRYGELGLVHKTNQTSFIQMSDLPELIKPVDVSCGFGHTALLSASRVLFMTGDNGNGQLGLDWADTLSRFMSLKPSSGVVAVSCGWKHTVTLRADGSVWACGRNQCGQLGVGDRDQRFTPTQMIGLENHTITEVIAGWDHTALLTKDGDVLVCGSGEDDLGKEDLLVATLLPKSPGLAVKQVAFAETYSVIFVVTTPASPIEFQATSQDEQARGCITEVERSIMRSLECPVCFKIMCAPIHQCSVGHSLCSVCWLHTQITVCPLCQEVFGKVRNICLESLSAEVQLPCLECQERMPTKELENHAEICSNRKYSCPLQKSCGWRGRPDTMLAHTVSAHPDQTWRDLPHLFLHPTSDELEYTDVLAAHDQVFILHRRYNKTSGTFQAVMKYIGLPENKRYFKFDFTFIMNADEIYFRRNVCADIDHVEDMFLSANSVLLENNQVSRFLHESCLVCQVDVVSGRDGRDSRSHLIRALVDSLP